MRPVSGRGSEGSHLAPCPHCGAANGVNAQQCWKCESALPAPVCDPVVIAQEPDRPPARPVESSRLEDEPDPSPFRAAAANSVADAATGDERDAGAPERLFATLGYASVRAARRRRNVAAGIGMLAIAAGVISYPMLQDPVRVALSPAELSRVVQPEEMRAVTSSSTSKAYLPISVTSVNDVVAITPAVKPSAVSRATPHGIKPTTARHERRGAHRNEAVPGGATAAVAKAAARPRLQASAGKTAKSKPSTRSSDRALHVAAGSPVRR